MDLAYLVKCFLAFCMITVLSALFGILFYMLHLWREGILDDDSKLEEKRAELAGPAQGKKHNKYKGTRVTELSGFDWNGPTGRRECFDCKHLVGYVGWWCENKEAVETRGTSFPTTIHCPFYKWAGEKENLDSPEKPE